MIGVGKLGINFHWPYPILCHRLRLRQYSAGFEDIDAKVPKELECALVVHTSQCMYILHALYGPLTWLHGPSIYLFKVVIYVVHMYKLQVQHDASGTGSRNLSSAASHMMYYTLCDCMKPFS